MSTAGDTFTVVASVGTATGIASLKGILEGAPSMKPIIGGAVLGAFLLFIAIWSTQVAKALALLVLATAVLVNGTTVFKAVDKAV